jgi:paraquat-inducible protein B
MSNKREESDMPEKSRRNQPEVPEAKLVKRRNFSLIWIVPVLAAAVAGWLIYRSVQSGTDVTIVFTSGAGLEAGQTPIKYRGVTVGEVQAVDLTRDAQHVEVHARLDKSAEVLARGGTAFWVVRPHVSAGALQGLETIMSGSYIQVQPSNGPPQKKFTGLEEPPPLKSTQGGLQITLVAPQAGSLMAGSPVYYRGLEVGSVLSVDLSEDASLVTIRTQIQERYTSLVRTNSKFWNAGGINVDLKLFGINFSAESFKSLVSGGISFATPQFDAPPAQQGSSFKLYEKPKNEWLE